MKIKILKDIPGYKAGHTHDTEKNGIMGDHSNFTYSSLKVLIEDGWAEEIKDGVDIEAIRNAYIGIDAWAPSIMSPDNLDNRRFYKAYLVVKKVIDRLNGDWKPIYEIGMEKYFIIGYDHNSKEFQWDNGSINQYTILPPCKNSEVTNKVMELCEPELKVLFGVK